MDSGLLFASPGKLARVYGVSELEMLDTASHETCPAATCSLQFIKLCKEGWVLELEVSEKTTAAWQQFCIRCKLVSERLHELKRISLSIAPVWLQCRKQEPSLD